MNTSEKEYDPGLLDSARRSLLTGMQGYLHRSADEHAFLTLVQRAKKPLPIEPHSFEISIQRKTLISDFEEEGLTWNDVFKKRDVDLESLCKEKLSRVSRILDEMRRDADALPEAVSRFFQEKSCAYQLGPVFTYRIFNWYIGEVSSYKEKAEEKLSQIQQHRDELNRRLRSSIDDAEHASFWGTAREEAFEDLIDSINAYINQERDSILQTFYISVFNNILKETGSLQEDLRSRALDMKSFFEDHKDLLKDDAVKPLISQKDLPYFLKKHRMDDLQGGMEQLAKAMVFDVTGISVSGDESEKEDKAVDMNRADKEKLISAVWTLISGNFLVRYGQNDYRLRVYADNLDPELYKVLVSKDLMQREDKIAFVRQVENQYFHAESEQPLDINGELLTGLDVSPELMRRVEGALKQYEVKKQLMELVHIVLDNL